MRFLATWLVVIAALLAAGVPPAAAKVSGQCVDCHTMHNSQNAVSMKLDSTPNTGGSAECIICHADTRAYLLRMDCLGCHAQDPNGGANIVSNMPQVAHNAGTDLAGGNFRNVFIDDSYGHNVHGFGAGIAQDSLLGNTPPGYDSNMDPSSRKFQPANSPGQIMCAGANGCHGNRDELAQYDSLVGAHHADDSILRYGASFTETGQGATVGTSYRFLYKVHGAEDSDWEATTSTTDHNEYRGAGFAARTSQSWTDIETMSQLCGECHGNFHASSGLTSSGPWIRHPSDAVMPNSAPYTSYATYSLLAPVARPSIADATASASAGVTAGTDIVFCLSCHRAHASPNYDALRWDYDTCKNKVPDAACGCFVCHSDKD